jgi:type IX secretion system PorP/SprF family membrane protein
VRNLRATLSMCGLAAGLVLSAQHTPLTSQYMFNGLLINPAYAGSRDALAANLTYRRQWVGFDGAPTTQLFSVHTPLKGRRLGLGIQVYDDRIGVSRETGVLTNYAYRIPFRKGRLQFGLGAGVSMLQANWSSVALQDRTDVTYATDSRGDLRPELSGGIFYYKKLFYIGASVPFAMAHTWDPEDARWSMSTRADQLQPMLTGGYLVTLNKALKLKPSTLIRYQQASGIQADLNANLIIRDKVWTGVSYRTGDAVVGMLEVLPTPQWRFGYAYDMGLNRLAPYHAGTHELMLQYEFGYRIRVRDPRYF